MSQGLPSHARVVIIGGGIVGERPLSDFFPRTDPKAPQRAPRAEEPKARFFVGFVGAGWSQSRPGFPS